MKKRELAVMLIEIAVLISAVVLMIKLIDRKEFQPVTPTPTPTKIPTQTTIPTQIPTIPTHCPTSTPTMTPSPTPTPVPGEVKAVGKNHKFKPYTRYHVYDLKNTAQYKLQQVARTDERTGIRVVTDPLGVDRYCVALGTYWAGGHPEHIGHCLDAVMVNGSTLHLVLADVKRTEDTINAGNRYGAVNYDVLEFIVDGSALPEAVRYYGNVSKSGEEFEGDVECFIVYDLWIEGFGEGWNK